MCFKDLVMFIQSDRQFVQGSSDEGTKGQRSNVTMGSSWSKPTMSIWDLLKTAQLHYKLDPLNIEISYWTSTTYQCDRFSLDRYRNKWLITELSHKTPVHLHSFQHFNICGILDKRQILHKFLFLQKHISLHHPFLSKTDEDRRLQPDLVLQTKTFPGTGIVYNTRDPFARKHNFSAK